MTEPAKDPITIPGGPARRRRWILLLTVLAVAAAGAGLLAYWWVGRLPVRFAAVEEGVLYRSGQPSGEQWVRLRDEVGIRTVIDLRFEGPDTPWVVEETSFCRDNGIEYVRIMTATGGLTDPQQRQFLDIVADPARRPVLVHCELGKTRTGMAVATYRIKVQGWSYQQALAEWLSYRDHIEPENDAYLRRLAGRAE